MSDAKKSSRVYFPGLNALRFIAAFLVLIHHVESFKATFGYPNADEAPWNADLGKFGVIFFFVLSGFLITYLLLVEKERHHTVFIKEFYIRRALRIWPLYFTLVLSGLFVMPHVPWLYVPGASELVSDDLVPKLLLFVFLLPNAALAIFPAVPFAAHAWSIGNEEQFYLVWPLLIKYFRPLRAILGVIVIIIVLKYALLFAFRSPKTLMFTMFDNMAIGALGAWVLYEKKQRILDFIYRRDVQVGSYLVVFTLGTTLPSTLYIDVVRHQVYPLFFIVILLNIATNPRSLVKIENKTFDYLGKISYGIYMLHPMCIGLVHGLMVSALGLTYASLGPVAWNAGLHLGTIALTIALAGLSYRFLEKPFIKSKAAFTKVLSGSKS